MFLSTTQTLPTDDLSIILWLIIMNPSLIYSHQKQRKSFYNLKRFNKALHTDSAVAICSYLRDMGTQRVDSLRILKRSCKIAETLPCDMPNACVISSSWIRLSEYTRFRTFFHISSLVASSGRPDLVLSSKDVQSRFNSPTQNST